MAKITKQVIENINQGGLADGRYSTSGAVQKMIGLNIHEDPGLIKVQQKTKADYVSGDEPAGNTVAIVPANNDFTYFFGETGVVFSRSSAGVYDELGTTSPATLYDAVEFNGDLYYTTGSTLGKYTPGAAWAARDDSFKTLGSDTFHPLIVIGNDLYVGNVNKIGKVIPGESAGGAVTDTDILLDDIYTIESLGNRRNNLVIGTRAEGTTAGSFAGQSKIFEWDLTSIEWTIEQEIPEFGISAFMELEGTMIFNAGSQGMLYTWDGSNARQFRRIPGDWTLGRRARIYKNAHSSYLGRLVFGVSFENGSPLQTGIYSLGGYDPKYPNVFNLEFVSRDGIAAARYLSCATINNDFLFSVSSGAVSTIDKVDTTNLYTGAYLITKEINTNRDEAKFATIRICYRDIPTGTVITMHANIDNADPTFAGTAIPLVTQTNKKYLESKVDISNAMSFQLKIATTAVTTQAPEIENVTIIM